MCSDCHSAHSIQRTDLTDFRLHIMDQCGRCHEEIAESYFDTYHGKVSKLGYLKTAKCYDCHGAHDILPVTDPRSRLSRGQHREDLRAVPPRLEPPFRRLPDARHAPRPQDYPVPLLHLLGDDDAPGRNARGGAATRSSPRTTS